MYSKVPNCRRGNGGGGVDFMFKIKVPVTLYRIAIGAE